MYEVTYEVVWPNGVRDRKTCVVNGEGFFSDFLLTLGLYKFVLEKTIGFRIISMRHTYFVKQ